MNQNEHPGGQDRGQQQQKQQGMPKQQNQQGRQQSQLPKVGKAGGSKNDAMNRSKDQKR